MKNKKQINKIVKSITYYKDLERYKKQYQKAIKIDSIFAGLHNINYAKNKISGLLPNLTNRFKIIDVSKLTHKQLKEVVSSNAKAFKSTGFNINQKDNVIQAIVAVELQNNVLETIEWDDSAQIEELANGDTNRFQQNLISKILKDKLKYILDRPVSDYSLNSILKHSILDDDFKDDIKSYLKNNWKNKLRK